MKRTSTVQSGARLGDILQATTLEQRSWIGAVVLAYNDAEASLHRLVGACIAPTMGPSYSITSRINGTEGLVQIVHDTVAAMALPKQIAALFKASLSECGFSYLKPLRDSVIHAELFDSESALGVAPGKRGKRTDVLLKDVALEGIYERLVLVRSELSHLKRIVSCKKAIILSGLFAAPDDQRLLYNEQDIQDATTRCLELQRQRLSLPPFPKFPDPPTAEQRFREWMDSPHPNKTLSIRLDDGEG